MRYLPQPGYSFLGILLLLMLATPALADISMFLRVEAQYRKGNIIVTRSWDDEILQIYWYEIHHTVKGEEFAVVAIFELPE